jgi:phytoene/squalene synthetase
MNDDSAILARSITRSSDKQTYFIIKNMVDKDLVDDCFRAYSYFRWVDDQIDDILSIPDQRRDFIEKQVRMVKDLYNGIEPQNAIPEERLLVDLINHNNDNHQYLRSYIENFLAAIKFDSTRNGKIINGRELDQYSKDIGKAVTDCIFFFIGNGRKFKGDKNRYHAATAAHFTHMLRDYRSDVSNGYINIHDEYLKDHRIKPYDINSNAFRKWVRGRVNKARKYFTDGKKYIDKLSILRCKIVAYWYCARFERILDRIEHDDYLLRTEYGGHPFIFKWFSLIWISIKVTVKHYFSKMVISDG